MDESWPDGSESDGMINITPKKRLMIFGMHSSKKELVDLAKAWVCVSLAFTILLAGKGYGPLQYAILFVIASLTVGVSFFLHEMAHKYMAQKYHCWAEFRSFDIMLVATVVMSFFGFIFAAPGAVMIAGHIRKDSYGKISMAGPLVNLVLAAIFGILAFTLPAVLAAIAAYGFTINAWLALFNMLPFPSFDGIKIWNWSWVAYVIMLVSSVGLFLLTFAVPSSGF
jgi:Zn-dependent protease